MKDKGVPASPSGHSAEPEPISVVSAQRASVPNAWQIIDEWCRERARKLHDRTDPHIAKGGSLDDPEYRRLLGQHQAFLAVRSFIHGSLTASAGEAGTAGTTEIGPVHEHATAESRDAQKEQP